MRGVAWHLRASVCLLLASLILRWPAAGSLLFNNSPRRLDRH